MKEPIGRHDKSDWMKEFEKPVNGWYLAQFPDDGYSLVTEGKDGKFDDDAYILKLSAYVAEGEYEKAFISCDRWNTWKGTVEFVENMIYATGLSEKFGDKFEDFDSIADVMKKSPKKLVTFISSNFPGKQVYIENVQDKGGYARAMDIMSKADFKELVVDAGLLDADKSKAAADDDGDWEE